MDILYVTRPIEPPWNEGSKNIVWQLAKGLKNHNPHLLVSHKNQPPIDNTSIVAHSIYSGQQLSFEQKIKLFTFLLFKMPPVDILHFFFVPTLLTSRLMSIVTTIHKKIAIQTVPCLPHMQFSQKLLNRLLFAQHKIVYSKHTEKLLQEFDILNITHINAGVETRMGVNSIADNSFRKKHGLPEDLLLVTIAGEYSRLGSAGFMKKILPELVEKCSHCQMLIAFRIMDRIDIKEENKLKQFVESKNLTGKVRFIGQVADFPSLLKATDILIFAASEMNGKIDTPLTLLEAMTNGLPIVSSDIQPIDEVFDNHKEFLVDPNDVSGLVSKVLSLVNDPKKRAEQGNRNKQRILRAYDLNSMVDRYESFYDSLQ